MFQTFAGIAVGYFAPSFTHCSLATVKRKTKYLQYLINLGFPSIKQVILMNLKIKKSKGFHHDKCNFTKGLCKRDCNGGCSIFLGDKIQKHKDAMDMFQKAFLQ